MNGYKCFYNGKSIEVYADTTYAAQLKAAKILKVKKTYQVNVVLCERDGDQVVHTADF